MIINFAQFCQRLNKSHTSTSRPTSAHIKIKTPKQTNLMNSTAYSSKTPCSNIQTSNSIRVKQFSRFSTRARSQNKCKSTIFPSSKGEKQDKYRYQVVNNHCVKKVQIEENNLRPSNSSHIKQVLFTSIHGMKDKAHQRHYFVTKRLKTIANNRTQRCKTQFSEANSKFSVSIRGTKIS